MRLNALLSVAALAALLAPAPAAAQAEDTDQFWNFMSEEAKNLTVAAPKPETVFDSVSNVTVIDRSMIERYNFSSVSEALRTLPGVSVGHTYLMHNIPTIRGALQEHYANKVLVMIDNVPMWNAVTGEGDLDRVGIDSVERIEVLLGPASVLYGSNALTGAINIVLRKPRKNAVSGRFGGGLASSAGGFAGTANPTNAGGMYAWAGADASYMLSADSRSEEQPSYIFTDEARARNSVKEYLKARSLNFTGKYKNSSVLFNASRGDQNSLGNELTLASGELFNEAREAVLLNYSYSFSPAWGDLKYAVTYDWQRRNIPRDAADNLRSDIVGSRLVNNLHARIPLPGGYYLEGGAAYEYRYAQRYLNYLSKTDTPQADNGMNGHLNRESSARLQAGYDGRPWKLLAGARYTDDENAGSNLSSRISAIYMLNDRNSLKAMFSQSFRSPTPFEQYFLNSPVTVVGNPDLKPERTDTFELSYLASRGRFFSHLTAYYTEYRDTIFRDLGNFTRDGITHANVNFYANASAYSSRGLELELRYEGPRTHAFLSLEALHGSRGDKHSIPAPGVFGLPGGESWNFRYVPDYTVSGGVSQDIGDFFAASDFNCYGRAHSLRAALGSQFWADASVGYRKGAVRHALAVRNLTDKQVMVPEYVRLRVVETLPLYSGRRLEYTFEYRF